MTKAYDKTGSRQADRRYARSLTRLAISLAVPLVFCGCASTDAGRTAGPSAAASFRVERWDRQYPQSRCIVTPHYRIYTDLADRESQDRIAQLMEGAYQQYQAIYPAPASQQPLRCFIFSRRDEWAAFTARNAGADATIYLKINRGAYAVDDWFCAFWLGDRGTFAVAAHEGWHQYAARHLISRLPPALEEGFACLFENITWDAGLPRWNLKDAPSRSGALAEAYKAGRAWPLADLLRLHAGDIVNSPRATIETFYAQDWALALFLLERYPDEMRRYFDDLAGGKAYYPPNLAHFSQKQWHPSLSSAQLEYYLHRAVADIGPEYSVFCRKLAGRYKE